LAFGSIYGNSSSAILLGQIFVSAKFMVIYALSGEKKEKSIFG